MVRAALSKMGGVRPDRTARIALRPGCVPRSGIDSVRAIFKVGPFWDRSARLLLAACSSAVGGLKLPQIASVGAKCCQGAHSDLCGGASASRLPPARRLCGATLAPARPLSTSAAASWHALICGPPCATHAFLPLCRYGAPNFLLKSPCTASSTSCGCEKEAGEEQDGSAYAHTSGALAERNSSKIVHPLSHRGALNRKSSIPGYHRPCRYPHPSSLPRLLLRTLPRHSRRLPLARTRRPRP